MWGSGWQGETGEGEHCSGAPEGNRAQGRRRWEECRLFESAVITDVAGAVDRMVGGCVKRDYRVVEVHR